MQTANSSFENHKMSAAFGQHLLTLATRRIYQPDCNISEISFSGSSKETESQQHHFTNLLPYPTAILSQFSA